MDVLAIIIGIILSVIFLRICGQQKKPIRAMVINSLCGVAALIAAAVITGFSGFGIAVNSATVLIASVLGMPGVAMILLTVFVI